LPFESDYHPVQISIQNLPFKELRERASLTQEQLAERVHVSRQTIISLEKGRYNPSILLAHNIAQVFRTSIERVFVFEEEEHS
jgi:putative transcriptional regulator